MLASLDEPPVAQRGLVYEPKYDGIRALVDLRAPAAAARRRAARRASTRATATTRRAQFPGIVDGARGARADARRARCCSTARSSRSIAAATPLGFQHIQGRIHLTGAADIARAEREQPAALIALRPAARRRRGPARPAARRAPAAAAGAHQARASGDAARAAQRDRRRRRPRAAGARAARRLGRPDRQGRPVASTTAARRTPAWRKMKLLKQQEFVVGGWTEPRQTRQHFGSLLLGYYDARRAAVGRQRRHGIRSRRSSIASPRCLRRARRTTSPVRRRVQDAGDAALGQARPRRRGAVHRVDERRTAATAGVSRHARRQEGERRATREDAGASAGVRRSPRQSRDESGDEAAREVQRSRRTRTPTNAAVDSRAVVDATATLERARRTATSRCRTATRCASRISPRCSGRRCGITKGELLRYYVEVSPLLLPAVDDRPLVMKRFPNGVDKPAFYQQRHPEAPPPGVRRERAARGHRSDRRGGPARSADRRIARRRCST